MLIWKKTNVSAWTLGLLLPVQCLIISQDTTADYRYW